MPLTTCGDVSISGVRWPLAGVTLKVGGAFSVSNEALGSEVVVKLESGIALLILADPIPRWPDQVWLD